MKKLICVILTLAMALSTAGCGNAPYADKILSPSPSLSPSEPDESEGAAAQIEGPYFQNGEDILYHGMPRTEVEAILGEADDEWNWEDRGRSKAIDFKTYRKMTADEVAEKIGRPVGQLGAYFNISAEEWDSFFSGLVAAMYDNLGMMISYENDRIVSILMMNGGSSGWLLQITPEDAPDFEDVGYINYIYSLQDKTYQRVENEEDFNSWDENDLVTVIVPDSSGGFLEVRHIDTIGFSGEAASSAASAAGGAGGGNGGAIDTPSGNTGFGRVEISVPEIPGLTVIISSVYKTFLHAPEGVGDVNCVLYNFIVTPETEVTFNKDFSLVHTYESSDVTFLGNSNDRTVRLYTAEDDYTEIASFWYNENAYDAQDAPFFFPFLLESGGAHPGAECITGLQFFLWEGSIQELEKFFETDEDGKLAADIGWHPVPIMELVR